MARGSGLVASSLELTLVRVWQEWGRKCKCYLVDNYFVDEIADEKGRTVVVNAHCSFENEAQFRRSRLAFLYGSAHFVSFVIRPRL